ncbi:ABC transporter ATP-binding protein [Streptococcus entericus]|uniref:ABC transporter ATP-binding protein n=1 Tax=Streptococcus entericus TaxID=155680 RepID=UPI000363C871|nr:ABC transporter ATP-binding protein [Streptococcus entericus]
MSMLNVTGVSHAYGKQAVLADIDLTVERGEIVALIGTSGVGKTTLFNLIAGIEALQEGEITIDGSRDFVGKVSYMLQKDLLLEHKTVLKNVALPLIIKGVKKAEAYDEARQLLERFGLLDYQDRYPQELSGGMRQRVALLRTYLFKHKLFLLDEAFSALDALTKRELHGWYLDTQRELGLSTLLITHDIDEALTLSDRIYVLRHRPGRVMAELIIERDDGQLPTDRHLAYKEQLFQALGL